LWEGSFRGYTVNIIDDVAWATLINGKRRPLMSVVSVKKETEVSPELQCVVDAALYRLVGQVFEGALKMTPIPCDLEISKVLRATLGDEAVRIWEEYVDELGF
jgi:hypothetical protein